MKKIFIMLAVIFALCFSMEVAKAATSPDGTTVTNSGSSITDATGVIWTLGTAVSVASNSDCSPKSCGSVVIQSGTPLNGTAAIMLLWFNGKLYQSNAAGLWWQWTGQGWLKFPGDPRPAGPPPPPPPPPTLAAASFVCTPVFQSVTMSTFVPTGATGLQTSILNQSKSPMTITAVASSAPEFQVSGLTLPAVIAPGATQVVTIKFVPTVVGKFTGTITFTANVNNGSFSMGVVGVAQ